MKRRPFAKRECRFTKVDREHGIAYGWAIISTINGQPYYDLHGDHIPMDACIKACTRYMEKSRASDDQHDEAPTGSVPFMFPVYKGLTDAVLDIGDVQQEGIVIGARLSDDVLAKIDAGDRRGFSIGGSLTDASYLAKRSAGAGEWAVSGTLRGDKKGAIDQAFIKHVLDAATKKSAPDQRRIFLDFEIDFISTVDWPAQEGALIRVVKGATTTNREPLLWLRKEAYLTSEDAGHQHVIDFERVDEDGDSGWTSYATSAGSEVAAGASHSHDFVIDPETGAITIAANEGHSHTVDANMPRVGKVPVLAPGTEVMDVAMRAPGVHVHNVHSSSEILAAMGTTAGKQTILDAVAKMRASRLGTNAPRSDAGQIPGAAVVIISKEHEMDKDQEIATLRKTLAATLVLAEMSDAQKAYRSTLKGADVEMFDKSSNSARDAEIKKAADADEVVYKCDDGTIIRKSHGQLMERMARKSDAAEALAKKTDAENTRLSYEKRADKEIPHLPGTVAVRALLLKGIDAIPDDTTGEDKRATAKAALAALVAGNKALEKRYRRFGKNVAGDPGETVDDPNAKLTELAKVYAKEHKVSFHKAYDEVMKTDEGAELYEDAQKAVPGAGDGSNAVDDFDDDDGGGDDGYEVVEDDDTAAQ